MLKTFGFGPTLAFQMPALGHDSVDKMEKRSEAHLLVICLPYVGLKLNIQKMKIMASGPITLRESFPRQVDKKSRGPQGERGLEFSMRKKGQTFVSLYIP